METLGEKSEAQEYFAEVEKHFSLLRGRPLILAPRDVGLVKQWHEAGLPLAVVRRGLERFFEREAKRERPRPRPATLAWCERDVYDAWEDWKALRVGGRPDEAAAGVVAEGPGLWEGRNGGGDRAAEHLAALPGALERAAAAAEAGVKIGATTAAPRLARALRALAARCDDLRELAARSGPAALERELGEAERALLRGVRREIGKEQRAAIAAEVRARVEPYRKGIDDKAYRVLVRKAEDRELLARFGIPRVVLFSF